LTLKLDHVALDSLRVSDEEFDVAAAALSPAALAAIDIAIANVRRFHEAQLPGSIDMETMPGVRCERVCHPIDAVGLYVPAGSAPLPSAAIMLWLRAGAPRRRSGLPVGGAGCACAQSSPSAPRERWPASYHRRRWWAWLSRVPGVWPEPFALRVAGRAG
jgi:hypothetical protein